MKGAAGTAVPVAEIPSLDIKGEAEAKTRFVAGLTALANAKQAAGADFDQTGLVKQILELLLDNAALPAQDAAQLAVGHGKDIWYGSSRFFDPCASVSGISVSIHERTIQYGSQVQTQ